MSYIRTFKTIQHINKSKEDKIRTILPVYQNVCKQISNIQWKLFYTNHCFNKFDNSFTDIDTPISYRYRQTAQNQVVATLKSYISLLKKQFNKKVYNSNLSDDDKRILYYINKNNGWFMTEGLYKKQPIAPELLKIAKCVMKELFKNNRKPSFDNVNMNLDNNVANISENNGSSSFDYWIKLSTLESGHPISLPVNVHKFFTGTNGELKKFCQINLTKDDDIQVCLIKECPQLSYTPLIDKIALDFGLRVLFADDFGYLFGRNLIDTLRYYDAQLIEITKHQQQLGLSVKTHRYNAILQYIRDLLKQEICRAINRIIAIHSPKEIVVEKLDFTDTDLSHQMNRILRNCGREWVEKKLNQVNQEFGIIITETNPAYSSQVCTNCGYVDKGNRPSQGEFKCKACGYTLNADVKSAREHLVRSSYKEKDGSPYDCYKSKESILYYIVCKSMDTTSDYVKKQQGYNGLTRVLTLMSENRYYEGLCSRLCDRVIVRVGSNVKTKGLRRKKKRWLVAKAVSSG